MSINKIKNILSIFIVSCILFLGIGYAAVSKDLIFGSDITGTTQEEVFITDFYPATGVTNGGSVNSNSFIKSILTSDITLDGADTSITYTVTMHNNADVPYCYMGTNYNTTLGYSNVDIDFGLSMVEGDWDINSDTTSVVDGNGDITFNITFFNEGDGSNLSLESVLQFLFIPLSDAQKVTLTYEANEYVDVFPKTETVARFPDLHFDVEPTQKLNNVARCNLDATPYYDATLKQIHVTGVDSAGNNANNEVKCEVYNSLNAAVSDVEFEPSNYTINNFLVLSDISDTGAGAEIPENLEFNVDLNQKYIYYDGVNTMLAMQNVSVVNIFNGYELTCTYRSPFIFLVDHEDAVLSINGGKYNHSNTGNLFMPKKGTILSRDADYYSTKGNIFMIGTHGIYEATMDPYSVHIEVVGGKIQTDGANIVHCTSRHQVFFSFVNVEAIAAVDFIVCNNNAGNDSLVTEDVSPSTYDNVRFYVTGGSITAGHYDFSTQGSYLFYTNNIKYGSRNTTGDMEGISTSDRVLYSDYNKYAVKNYTKSTDEDWYYVKDIDGNQVYASNGKPIKVGDRITFNSVKNTGYNMAAINSSYSDGSGIQIVTPKTSTAARPERWMFLASSDPGYYNIVPYYYPFMMIFIHVDEDNIQSTGGNYTNLKSISDYQSSPAGRFRCKNAVDSEGNIIAGAFSILNKVDAGWPHGKTWGKFFALDIANSTTMKEGLKIQGYKDNDTAAQQWILKKHNK